MSVGGRSDLSLEFIRLWIWIQDVFEGFFNTDIIGHFASNLLISLERLIGSLC